MMRQLALGAASLLVLLLAVAVPPAAGDADRVNTLCFSHAHNEYLPSLLYCFDLMRRAQGVSQLGRFPCPVYC
jgi:hypothetical protein